MVKIKKIENKKLELFLALCIEIIEFSIFISINHFIFEVPIVNIIAILLTFFICKMLIKRFGYKNGHYKIVSYFDKGWRKCVFYTFMFVTGYFLVSKYHLEIGILFTIFGSLITSDIFDIEELTQCKKIQFKPVYSWVRRNQTDERVIAYERSIKTKGDIYKIYRDVFLGYSTKEECALDLGYDQSNQLDPQICRMIGTMEQLIPEIEDLNK